MGKYVEEEVPYVSEYEKLVIRMNPPRVIIDNDVRENTTVVKMDSARKHENLLDAVQLLTDLNLHIKKVYIISDGKWLMDVFHVTDQFGNVITDENLLNYIKQSIVSLPRTPSASNVQMLTTLELTGNDRVGLLSEVFAVLAEFQCDVVEAKLWTHNGRIASLIYFKDCETGISVVGSSKMEKIEHRLRSVLSGSSIRSCTTLLSSNQTQTDRRLHQMMFMDRYELSSPFPESCDVHNSSVVVRNWVEKGYTVVNIQCRDRLKLLFDVVCCLNDMNHVVFHATVDTRGHEAFMEFYIKNVDGTPICIEAEKQRLNLCISAAIERRTPVGKKLELKAVDRPGLLADLMRRFRENLLNVTWCEISTRGENASNVFYVTNRYVEEDGKYTALVLQMIGEEWELKVAEAVAGVDRKEGIAVGSAAVIFHLWSMVRKNLSNLGLIWSHSS